MSVQIRVLKNVFKVTFKNDSIIREDLKQIEGRKFKVFKDEKFWTVPIEKRSELEAFAERHNAYWIKGKTKLDQTNDINIPPVEPLPELTHAIPAHIYSRSRKKKFDEGDLESGYEVRPFQKAGVAYGLKAKTFLNGDQPGLGKTIQSIVTLEIGNTLSGESTFPCLIICPATLKQNWKDEIKDWTGKDAVILDDKCKNTFQFFYTTGIAEYFIVNYESLEKYFVDHIDKNKGSFKLADIHFKDTINIFKSIIIDEVHRLKDHNIQQAKFVKGICTDKEWIIELSGTPAINKPKDLMSPLAMMERLKYFGNSDGFKERFCSGPNEANNLTELNYLLNKYCYYRRQKDDVMKELPAKTRQIVKLNITNRHEYNEAKKDLLKYLKEWKDATDEQLKSAARGLIMVQIGHLKKISARGKIKDAVEWISDVIANGDKLVLFIHHHEIGDELKKHFPSALFITGREDEDTRDFNKKKFQSDPEALLLICGIKAGIGLNLYASSRTTHLELPWTFADCEQNEDRCHRMGQTDNVTCSYLLGIDTYDEQIFDIIMSKKEMHNAITGTNDQVEESVVNGIIDLFNSDKIKL